jgi:hypothetical protein
VLAVSCSLALGAPSPALATSLDFDSLPSSQAWIYRSPAGLVEAETYSVNGTALRLNTVGDGVNAAVYEMPGVVPITPFSILLRARILSDEGELGFGFSAHTGAEVYDLALDTDTIRVVGGPRIDFDGTVFHDFRMDVAPGLGFEFFVDGQFFSSGLGTPAKGPNTILFGDGLAIGVDNARAEITQLIFTPEPSTALLLTCGLVVLAARGRGRAQISSGSPKLPLPVAGELPGTRSASRISSWSRARLARSSRPRFPNAAISWARATRSSASAPCRARRSIVSFAISALARTRRARSARVSTAPATARQTATAIEIEAAIQWRGRVEVRASSRRVGRAAVLPG